VVTGYELEVEVRFMAGARSLSVFTVYIPDLGPTRPLKQRIPENLSPGIKRSRREADHSPKCSVEVKNIGAIPPLPYISSWYSAYLIKPRDNFTFFMWTK
jgi:hypothetical protein